MSWKDKMQEFGGGDLAFLSEDGEVIKFIVVGEPALLTGRYKGKPSDKIGCPVVTEDGFQLLVTGKRLARKLSKYEGKFDDTAFMAIRHGVQGDIETSYELKILDDVELTLRLLEIKERDFKADMIEQAVEDAASIMGK
ncbi:MAG: hypothetical protein MUP81_03665 [Dehalococcoidia bacterium]|nr:hypothetical protein [Dehalococcoidia bacterium]